MATSASTLTKVRRSNPTLRKHRFVEAKHPGHLLDGVLEVAQRFSVARAVAQSIGHTGELPLQLGEGVTLNMDPWKGAAIKLGHRDISATRQNARPLIGHLIMIAYRPTLVD